MPNPYDFTDKELGEWLAAPAQARGAMLAVLDRAIDAAHDSFAAAQTEREAAVSQGVVRCAKALRNALQGAPARQAALAMRRSAPGNPPGVAGVV